MSSVKIDVESGYYTTVGTVTEKGEGAFIVERVWNIRVLNYSGKQPECHWDSAPSDSAKHKVDMHFGECLHILDAR
jgi:hypothetical protein